MLVKEGLWVVEGVIEYGGGQVFDLVLIMELCDEDVARQMVLRRAVRSTGVAGAVGRADGTLGFRAQLNFRQ